MIQLLANALHYSNKMVTVHCDLEEDNLVMQIRDNGIGIVAAEQPQIFELFFRGSNVAGRRGLGAGLYLASQLATLLGGTIEFTSEIGQGSVFALRLPTAP